MNDENVFYEIRIDTRSGNTAWITKDTKEEADELVNKLILGSDKIGCGWSTVGDVYLRKNEIDIISILPRKKICDCCDTECTTPAAEPEVIEDLNEPADTGEPAPGDDEKLTQAYDVSLSSMMLNGDNA